jgi:hypothetical protein
VLPPDDEVVHLKGFAYGDARAEQKLQNLRSFA